MPCVRPALGVTTAHSLAERAGARRSHASRRSRHGWAEWAARLGPVIGLMLCLLPGWVLACPTCVERAPESMVRSALLVGGMLLLPFLLVALGVWAAIRTARGDAKRSE